MKYHHLAQNKKKEKVSLMKSVFFCILKPVFMKLFGEAYLCTKSLYHHQHEICCVHLWESVLSHKAIYMHVVYTLTLHTHFTLYHSHKHVHVFRLWFLPGGRRPLATYINKPQPDVKKPSTAPPKWSCQSSLCVFAEP